MKKMVMRKSVVLLTLLTISGAVLGCSTSSNNSIKEKGKVENNLTKIKEEPSNKDTKDSPTNGSTLPGTLKAMNDESYWTQKLKEPKAVIMTNEQIDKFNNKIIEKVPVVYNLKNYKIS